MNKENPAPVLTMDDVRLRTQQIARNLQLLSDGLSTEIPNKTDDLNQQSLAAIIMADRLWDTYIPVLDFLTDALLALSEKAEEAARAELHQENANSQALGNLEGGV